jgi:hypothetical protein
MKPRFLSAVTLIGLCVVFAAAAVRAEAITVALVPGAPPGTPQTFAIGYEDSGRREMAKLSFNVQAIPAGVKIQSVVLRLLPSRPATVTQQVRIFADDKYAPSLGQLVIKPGAAAVDSTGTGLVGALANAKQTLDLYLRTDSIRTNLQYHSGAAGTSAARPRLIVSWTDPAPPVTRVGRELRYRGNLPDVTPWRNDAPTGAVLSTPLSALGFNQVVAGPVFRGAEILLIAVPAPSAAPTLYGIGWNGQKHWEYALPKLADAAKGWKYLHVDAQDRLLAFANDERIRVFSAFGANGPAKVEEKPVTGMLLSKRPAVSAGGMVTFLNDTGYVYTLSPWPGLDELWRSSINVGKAPPPVMSPRHGDDLVYVIAIDDKDHRGLGLLVYDAARGDRRFPPASQQPFTPVFPGGSALGGFQDFHPPLVVEGKDHDWVFLSGFGVSTGVLEGYRNFAEGSPDQWREVKKGPVSRCIAPPPPASDAEPVIYCIQDGQFRGFRASGPQVCASDAKGLGATSNLVADGAGNVYFWNETAQQSGVFYGFDRSCKSLFSQPLKGLPAKPDGSDVLELRAGPNGVFYATSNTELLAIQPTRSGTPSALVADTRYAIQGPMALPAGLAAPADGPVILAGLGDTLALGNLQIPATADVTCRAGKSISFGAGFAVAKGGVVRCEIDAAVIRAAP